MKRSKGCRWWLTRIGIGVLGVLVLLLVAMYAYASIKDAQARTVGLPRDSLLVDVGGRDIHVHAMGLEHDGPAVVLISGAAYGTTKDSGWWAGVQPELAKTMRVYTFDYAGYAWSDPNPEGVSYTNTADDLHAVLTALGEEEVILVGFATASNTTLVYHHRYPDEPRLRGIIWLDADVLHPEIIDWYKGGDDMSPLVLHSLIDLGVGRLFYEWGFLSRREQWVMEEKLSDHTQAMFDWDYYDQVATMRGTRHALRAMVDCSLAYEADLDYAASLPLPTDIPLFVIQTDMLRFQSERDPERAKVNELRGPYMTEWYHTVAENVPGGRYIHIPDSEHFAMLDQSEALIEVIKDMVELVTTTTTTTSSSYCCGSPARFVDRPPAIWQSNLTLGQCYNIIRVQRDCFCSIDSAGGRATDSEICRIFVQLTRPKQEPTVLIRAASSIGRAADS